MGRILLALCLVVSASACVNLDKPEKVAECAATNSCVNAPLDGAPAVDTGRADKPGDGKRDVLAIDGSPTNGDGLGTPGDVLPTSDDTSSVVEPDVPGIVPDAAADPPVVIGDDGAPITTPDAPLDQPPIVNPDAAADAARDLPPPDTRDAYRDVAAGICAPGGVLQPAGTVCRAAVGPCDVDETCDGVNADCPADKLASASKECRAAAGDCDVAETCSGAGPECPPDGFKQAGTVCREAAGVCDYAESCPGNAAACPSDSLKQSTVVCREAVNVCDPPENCTGLGASCPQDVPPYARPAAPTGVTATPGELQATLSWSAVSGATAYNIKRSTIAGGPYTTIATGVLASPFVDKGLDSTKTYYYVVSAVNTIASCESATGSAEVSVKPTGICVPPAAPTVTATPGNGQVTLAWAAVSGATAYAIDRSETSGTGYASLASVDAPATTYVDKTALFGKTYYYKVTTKGECDSDPSAEVAAAPLCAPAATAPTGLAATTPNTGGVVVLTWTAVPDAETTDRYYIMRKPASATTYAKIDEVSPPAVSYSDTEGIVDGTAYNYAVTYYNGTCTSGNSNVVTATPACVMDKPVLTLTPGNEKVDLSWTAPPNGSLSGFEIYRKDTGSFVLVKALTGAGSTTYSDTGLTDGTTYTYYVTAVGNCSADSDPQSTAPFCTPLPKPLNLKATAGDGQVSLDWDNVAGADHYTVKRSDTSGGPYTALVPASPITTPSYTDTGLTNGKTYYYVVTVSNGFCDSAESNEASAAPGICAGQGAPGTPRLSINPSTQVKIDWDAANPPPPNGYFVSRSSDGTTWTSLPDVPQGTLTYTDSSNLTVGALYYYKVTAKSTDCGTPSAAASITLSCQKPPKPTGLSATNNNSNGEITVDWTPTPGATGYILYRDDGAGGAFTTIGTNPAKPFTDTDVWSGKTYRYQVRATNANGQCTSDSTSDTASAVACRQPLAPAGLTATVGVPPGSGKVALVWSTSANADSYELLRGPNNGPYTTSVYTGTATSYTEQNLTNDTSYYYVVKARNGGAACASAASGQVRATPRACQILAASVDTIQFNTTGAFCFVTCWDLRPGDPAYGGWNCSNADGRTVTVNNQSLACGATLPARNNSAYTFSFTGGTKPYASAYWWNNGAQYRIDCP